MLLCSGEESVASTACLKRSQNVLQVLRRHVCCMHAHARLEVDAGNEQGSCLQKVPSEDAGDRPRSVSWRPKKVEQGPRGVEHGPRDVWCRRAT